MDERESGKRRAAREIATRVTRSLFPHRLADLSNNFWPPPSPNIANHFVSLLRPGISTMSIWGTLTGQRSSSSPSNSSSTRDPSPSSSSSTSFQPTAFDPASAQDVSSFLDSAALPDPSRLHPLAGLNRDTLDYLTLDESALSDLPGSQSALPSRGWSDDLCYGTGVTYLSALTLGGTWGMVEGLRRSPATAPPKLRLNSVLNSMTRRGPFLGNSAGVIAMVYNGINSTIGYYRGRHDSVNSIVAGALSGMLFKSTKGVRPMMISGGLVASAAGVWAVSTILCDRRASKAKTVVLQLTRKTIF